MIVEAFERLVAGHEGATLGPAIAEAGFPDLLVPEAAGGAGAALADLFGIARACGRALVAWPVPETMLARAWFPGGLPDGAWAVLRAPSPIFPHARAASHAVFAAPEGGLALCTVRAGGDDPWGTGSATAVEAGEVVARAPGDGEMLAAAAAALAAARIAGALEAAAALALEHVGVRRQFGRPLGAFQAVQHLAARLAEEVAAATAAAEGAFAGPRFTSLASAVAKVRGGEAAAEGAAIAHQLHGAIGMTDDYGLARVRRAVGEWRVAFGGEAEWARRLARLRLERADGTAVDFLREEGGV